MAKKISERERLLSYAMTATKDQLDEALELFRTASKSRFKPQTQSSRRKKKPDEPKLEVKDARSDTE